MGYEKINQPDHYKGNGMKAIDVIEAYDLNFSLGSAIKYILRAGAKPNESFEEDIGKAIWYLQREIEHKNNAINTSEKP
jgi:hypothetical protein